MADAEIVGALRQRLAAQETRDTATADDVRTAQEVFALAMRLYLAVVARREDECDVPPPLPSAAEVGATECLIVANELLKCADVDVFELGLFRQYGVY